jgi:hypothetical protein
MPTGACGIDCDVCRLRLIGVCSSCGSGRSQEARQKLDAQERIFGGNCSILACAVMNRVAYCSRDCSSFPCENFASGPYPFSPGFLDMQRRRRRDLPPARDWNDRPVQVPGEYWKTLSARDLLAVSNFTLARPDGEARLVFPFLREEVRIDIGERRLEHRENDIWEPTVDPLLEIVTLLYLNRVDALYPIGGDMVGIQDLKSAHFFTGPHVLRLDPLLERYGRDTRGFAEAAAYLSGTAIDAADAAFRLMPFPRIPLYFLLWGGDGEFEPKVSVLFDRSIENCLPAAGIWGMVNRVTTELLRGAAGLI